MNRLKKHLRLVGVVLLLILLEFLGRGLAVFEFPLLGMLILLVNIGFTLFIAYRWKLLKKGDRFWTKQAFKTIGWAFIYSRLFMILGTIVLELTSGFDAQSTQDMTLDSLPVPLYFVAFSATLSAPILEEFVFRGLLMGKVFSPKSYWGLVISSLLFGLVHQPTDAGSWLMYVGAGFVLGWLYRKTERLDYCMMLHFVNNGLAMLLLVVATQFGLT